MRSKQYKWDQSLLSIVSPSRNSRSPSSYSKLRKDDNLLLCLAHELTGCAVLNSLKLFAGEKECWQLGVWR